MRIAITGIAGFLGGHLAQYFIDQGHSVVGCDNMSGADIANVPAKADFMLADCCDISSMRELTHNCGALYHCAANPHEGLSVFSPSIITRNISQASASVFSAAVHNRVKRVVFCSSMARYGSQETPFREYYAPAPQDPYAIAKVASEDLLKCLADVHGFNWVIAVPHNIIGPGQKYDDPFRNVASIFINLMKQGRQPTIYGDGSQQRCFSYIDDCLSCLGQMLTKGTGEVINIGPDEEHITILELAELIADILGFTLDPIFIDPRPQEVRHAICSSDRARELLGYETKTSLRDGLAKMAEAIEPRPFRYHLPIEIVTDKTPQTWVKKLY